MAGDNNKKNKDTDIEAGAGNDMPDGASVIAREAEQFVATLSSRIAEEAEKKAQDLLSDYEEKIQNLVVESREELMAKSMEVLDNIRQAIINKARETSSGLVEKIVADKNEKATEMTTKLQGAAIIEAPAEPEDSPELDEVPTGDINTAETKPTEVDFKQARVAAELGYKIDNLGSSMEAGESKPVDNEKKTDDIKAEEGGPSKTGCEDKEEDKGDIDDFVRYLSQ